MSYIKSLKKSLVVLCLVLFLNACNGKIPGADARKIPYDPNERVKRNLEQGKVFRLDESLAKEVQVILNLQLQMNSGELH